MHEKKPLTQKRDFPIVMKILWIISPKLNFEECIVNKIIQTRQRVSVAKCW
jgi:hypothetical protein